MDTLFLRFPTFQKESSISMSFSLANLQMVLFHLSAISASVILPVIKSDFPNNLFKSGVLINKGFSLFSMSSVFFFSLAFRYPCCNKAIFEIILSLLSFTSLHSENPEYSTTAHLSSSNDAALILRTGLSFFSNIFFLPTANGKKCIPK